MWQFISKNINFNTSQTIKNALLSSLIMAALCGCSVSYPLAGLLEPNETASTKPADPVAESNTKIDLTMTSSIPATAKSASPLAAHLKPSDLASANPALNLAMETDTSVRSIAWSNVQTGTSGAFMPVGAVETQGDESCRKFRALLHPSMAPQDQTLSGVACKTGAGAWSVKTLDNPDKAG